MADRTEIVRRALRRHGITDSAEYLDAAAQRLPVETVADPFVELRGNVHMMLKHEASRDDVDEVERSLRYM